MNKTLSSFRCLEKITSRLFDKRAGVKIFLIAGLLSLPMQAFSQHDIFETVDLTGYPVGTTFSGDILHLPPFYYKEAGSITLKLKSGYAPAASDLQLPDTTFTCDTLRKYTIISLNSNTGVINFNAGNFCTGQNDKIDIRVTANTGSVTDFLFIEIPIIRVPVKTVLVMDISGSMNGMTIDGERRWDVLKSAVDKYTFFYEFFKREGDKLGMTYFTDVVFDPGPPIGGGFIDVTEANFDPTRPHTPPTSGDHVLTDMNSRVPLRTTAMGKGLYNSKIKLQSDLPSKYRRISVLFTDGLQNVPPFVNTDGYSLTDGNVLNVTGSPVYDSVHYYIIAAWLPGTTPPVLTAVAEASNGGINLTSRVTDSVLEEYFLNTLEKILHGSSPQRIGSFTGMVNNNTIIHTVNINNNITKSAILISYAKNDSLTFGLEKDGAVVPADQYHGSGFTILGVNFENNGNTSVSGGVYKLSVTGKSSRPYKIIAMADDHRFDYKISLNKPAYFVGDTIKFSANISMGGNLINKTNDTVIVTLFKPGDDVGNLLATFNTQITDNKIDAGTSAQQKYELLFSSDSSFADALLPVEQRIVLQNDGNGLYKGSFENTDVTGVYSMLVYVKSSSVETGIIERERIITTLLSFAEVKPEAPEIIDNTTVTVVDTTASVAPVNPSTGDSNSIDQTLKPKGKHDPEILRIRPKNKFGYYLGPGYTQSIQAKIISRPKGVSKKIESSVLPFAPETNGNPWISLIHGTLDGSYYIHISGIGERENPKIEILVGDEIYYYGKVYRIPFWFYLLIIILVILALIIRLLKNKNLKIYQYFVWVFGSICILILGLHYLGYLNFLY